MPEQKPWHEKDENWAELAAVLFSSRRRANTPAEVEQIAALTGLEQGSAVLDLCCGVGRHSLELARRGYRVTGVDRTRLYLDEAASRAAEEGLPVEFVEDDMRLFCRPAGFDAALNFFTSFGYFADPADDRKVLENVHRSLKPGGLLLMEMIGKEILARIFQERDWHEDEDGTMIIEERKVSQNWNWIDSRWIIFRGARRFELTVSHRLYSAAELAALLRRCGFQKVEIYGSLTGTPYDHQATRLVALAHR